MRKTVRIAIAFQSWRRSTGAPVDGAARFAKEQGGIELIDVHFREDRDVPNEVNRFRPDGIITQIAEPIYHEIGDDFFRILPLVNVGWDLYPRGIHSVCVASEPVASLAHAHLRKAGYAEIGMMFDSPSAGADAFIREFCAASGRRDSDAFIYRAEWPGDDVAHDPGPNRDLQNWLSELPKPIGVVTAHGYHGLWLIQECERLNIKVPEEVGILSRIDENVCLFSNPAITSFGFAGEEVGYEAMRMLHGLLLKPSDRAELVKVEPRGIVERGSTGPIAYEGEEISRALQFIQQHAANGIQVDDVLDHTQTMSRSKFYSLFLHRVGRSPAAEIRRVRIKKAKQLLRETKMSITHIAHLCGFSSLKQFSDSFRRAEGVTARQFRNEVRN